MYVCMYVCIYNYGPAARSFIIKNFILFAGQLIFCHAVT